MTNKKRRVTVIEEPTNKKVAGLDYMEFHSGRSKSSSSCEDFMIGCCIIHPL